VDVVQRGHNLAAPWPLLVSRFVSILFRIVRFAFNRQPSDLEVAPRDARAWLKRRMHSG
jgi:hypothetical protein